jgi:Divergent InlB B-repeat domain/CARDB
MERRSRCVVIATVALMWCSTAWGADQMAPKAAPARPMEKSSVPIVPGTVLPGSAPKIVISPWNLTANNNWPEFDTRVTLTFQIKNHGQGRVENIPWAIHDASLNRTFKTGTQGALAPGETIVISTVWQPNSGGPHLLQAYVDPSGTALKNTATQTVVTLNLLVPTPGKHFLRIGLAGTGRGRVTGNEVPSDCDNSANRQVSGFGTCFVEVAGGTRVTLQAWPDTRNDFVGWSNECRITRNDANGRQICEVQVNAATVVSGGFAPR